MKTQKEKLCPACGEKTIKTGKTTDGRIILMCGDACYARTDKLGREYWMLRPTSCQHCNRPSGKLVRVKAKVADGLALCPFANKNRRHYVLTSAAAAKLGFNPSRKYGYVIRMMPPIVTYSEGKDIEGLGWWPMPRREHVQHLSGWYRYKADAVRRAEELNATGRKCGR